MDDSPPTPKVSADEGATMRAPDREVVFNRYELLAELGKGGMGVVWLALDRELDSRVALKFLREEMTTEDHALKELKSEVLINRDLAHPNIIKTFDFVTDSRRSAISMEFVDGTNLHKLKTQRPGKIFEVEDIRSWVFQLCDAMDYAHRQKVVHRDIKPANLMVNDRGELKVGDFGIGRTVADTINRVTRNTAGTPPYMSPQQTMGEKSAPADDIYSIGATIYDLLTGDPPFFRGAIREQTLGTIPPSMAGRRKELGRAGKPIPPEWEKAVAAALAKEPAARPPTARALREIIEGKVTAVSATAPRRAGLWWAAAGTVLLLAAAGGVFYWQKTSAPTTATTAAQAPAKIPAQSVISAPAMGGAEAASPATNVAPTPAVVSLSPAQPAVRTPVEDFIQTGRITAEEGAVLNQALRGVHGDTERALAVRTVIEHIIAPEDWRLYTGLVPPADETVAKLRPLLAAEIIRENEFGWLRGALAGQKGEAEQMLARQAVEGKTLPMEEWRTQTDLYPREKRDPFMEKVKPLLTAGTVTPAEGQWLRDALAGEKPEAEKTLAARLVEEKSLTSGQWRAKTGFSYLLEDNVELDPARLPPAIDLALGPETSVRLLRIDPGAFVRGSPREEPGRRANEQIPERAEIAKPFYIGVYEVTQAQFESLAPRSPSYWRGNPNWPIDQVDWRAVMSSSDGFIGRLNRLLAVKYGGAMEADLPTEDEWEYACRAGTQNSFNNGRDITDIRNDRALDPLANYGGPENGSPKPVGSFLPNAWGLYDMHGNVMEWCQGRYQRGGHWQSKASDCRVAARVQSSADAGRSNKVGFRLVLRYRDRRG